jgi:peptidase M28-like protein
LNAQQNWAAPLNINNHFSPNTLARYSEKMPFILRTKYCVGGVLLLISLAIAAESVQYKPVSRDVVEARLRRYSGNNKQREATIKQMFTDAGCDDQHLSEQPVKESRLPNVICALPGSSDEVIIVGAHFDHVPDVDGVVDNWSGASLLPSIYEAVKAVPRKHTYLFVAFTDEEQGLVGSSFYARSMTKEQVAATTAMVNMDTLGLGPTEIWGSHADKGLNSAMAYVAKQLNVPVASMNVEQIGASADSESFAARKIPSITIHSLTQEAWSAHILHSPKDKFSAMHLSDYYQTYQLVAAYVAFLDQFSNAAPARH